MDKACELTETEKNIRFSLIFASNQSLQPLWKINLFNEFYLVNAQKQMQSWLVQKDTNANLVTMQNSLL